MAGYGDVLSPGLRIHDRRSRGRRSDLLKVPNEFAAVIYEFRNGPARFVPGRLSNLSINPLTCDFHKDEVMESLFIEIIRSHERNVIVDIIYRPPNQNVNDFVIRMNGRF